MSRTIVALFVVLLALPATARDPESKIDAEARAFLSRVIEGMGGDAALAAIKGMRISYRGLYSGMPYESEIIWMAPNRLVFNLDAGDFTGSMGMDGDMTWTAFMCPPARTKGSLAVNMKEWRNHNEILLLRPLLYRKGITIKMGATSILGVLGQAIHVVFPGGWKAKLSFVQTADGKWHLGAADGDTTQMDGKKGRFLWTLGKPTRFGAVTLPAEFGMKTFIDGQMREDMTEEIVSVEWNPTVTDATFAVPKLSVPLMKPVAKDVPETRGLSAVHEGPYDRMGETIARLRSIMQKRGLMQAGPVNAIYLNNPHTTADPADLRTRIIIPCGMIEAPPDLPKGVTLEVRPAGKCASIFARGPDGTADVAALMALFRWIGEKDLTPGGPAVTLYSHDPNVIVAEDLFTEVQIPIK